MASFLALTDVKEESLSLLWLQGCRGRSVYDLSNRVYNGMPRLSFTKLYSYEFPEGKIGYEDGWKVPVVFSLDPITRER